MIAADVFFLRPDWAEKMQVEYRYDTLTKRGLTGKEKRVSLRSLPVKSLRFTGKARNPAEAIRARLALYKNQDKIFGVPFWPDVVALTADVEAGALSLPVTTTAYRHFDGAVVLTNGQGAYEVVTGTVAGGTTLTLDTGAVYPWPVGTLVLPFFQAWLEPSLTAKSGTADDLAVTVRFEEAHAEQIALPAPDISALQTYQGLPLLPSLVDFSGSLHMAVGRDVDDFQAWGPRNRFSPQDYPTLTYDWDWQAFDRGILKKTLDLFRHCRGRLGTFWGPSHVSDLKLSGPFSASATDLPVVDSGFGEFFQTCGDLGRFLALVYADGTVVCREITAYNAGPGTITLDSAPGKDCPGPDYCKLSFITPARFDNDAFEMDWTTTDSVAGAVKIKSLLGDANA